MKTTHQLLTGDARFTKFDRDSIDLVITSPPYPMIAMWDEAFSVMSPESKVALDSRDGQLAWELMHEALDLVWSSIFGGMKEGGIACINIGDATRTVDESFRLYPNAARITNGMIGAGFTPLPDIIWRKPTNAPNKFMGSGMLPPGAYVTYEHEYILIFRKGKKRSFSSEAQKQNRRKSAYFWEERNRWFSDIWQNISGIHQMLASESLRDRSGAFPFTLPMRLIQMYSVYGDTVLDPFVGTGTTMAAAIASARSSVGIEIDTGLHPKISEYIRLGAEASGEIAQRRIRAHLESTLERTASSGEVKHNNVHYGFPVVTTQERLMELPSSATIVSTPDESAPKRLWTADHVIGLAQGHNDKTDIALEVSAK
jgi:modification methylase